MSAKPGWQSALIAILCALLLPSCSSLTGLVASPTPTATPVAIPSAEQVHERYEEQILPFLADLEGAKEAPAGFELGPAEDWEIILIPLDERLYYLQTLLLPDWGPRPTDAAVKLYVAYSYKRGGGLVYDIQPFGATGPATTQAVLASVDLVVQDGAELYLLETVKGYGGAGCHDLAELVTEAVVAPEGLGPVGEEIERLLEATVGYATGVDWDGHDNWDFERGTRAAALQWVLHSEYWSDRLPAAEALVRCGYLAVPGLIEALYDEEPLVSTAAAHSLGWIGPEEGVAPALLAALQDDSSAERDEIVWALGQMGPEEGVLPALLVALSDESGEVRQAAASALGELGPEEGVIGALAQALVDEDSGVGYKAAAALGKFGEAASDAVPALIAALREGEARVRASAAEALGKIGPQEVVVQPLIDALKDEDGAVRREAAEALRAITGRNKGSSASSWQQWWDLQK